MSPARSMTQTRRVAKILGALLAARPVQPVLIVGSGRSGTTLLARLLGNHPQIAGYPGEANDLWHPELYPWATSRHRDEVMPMWYDPRAFTHESLRRRTRHQPRHVSAVFGWYQRVARRPVMLTKSAMVTFLLAQIDELFPDARLIHVVRDGRAVTASYLKKTLAAIESRPAVYAAAGINTDLEPLVDRHAECWVAHMDEAERQCEALRLAEQGRWFEVRYEDLCTRGPDLLREIADYLGVSPDGIGPVEPLRNTNDKYRQQLDAGTIERMTRIMRPALARKGYL